MPNAILIAVDGATRSETSLATLVDVAGRELVLRRRLDDHINPDAAYALTGTWPGAAAVSDVIVNGKRLVRQDTLTLDGKAKLGWARGADGILRAVIEQ